MDIYKKVLKENDDKSITKVFNSEYPTILTENWSDSGTVLQALDTSHTLPTPKMFKIILFKCKKKNFLN